MVRAVSWNGKDAGTVTVSEQGLYICFYYNYGGVLPPLRLLVSAGGRELNLGIPAPRGENMELRRSISRKLAENFRDGEYILRPIVDNTVENGERAADNGKKSDEKNDAESWQWKSEPHPEKYLKGEGRIPELRDALVCRRNGELYLAIPWQPGGVFPLEEAFRRGKTELLKGRNYMAFPVGEEKGK